MDALLTETTLRYDGPAPLLVAATSEAALRRARDTAEMAGLRAVCQLGVPEALERLRKQPAACGIWVELDADGGGELDALLDEVEERSASRRFGAVVSVTPDLVDSMAGRMLDGRLEYLIDGDAVERLSALAMATAVANAPPRANDVSRDPGAERLRQLSDEVSRIAATLARLSTVPAAPERLARSVEVSGALHPAHPENARFSGAHLPVGPPFATDSKKYGARAGP